MENMPPSQQPPSSPPSTGLSERQWAVVLNLSGFLGVIVPTLGNVIGPLIIWLIKKPDSALLDRVGTEVVNFQISFTVYFFVAGLLCMIFIGFLIIPVLIILWLVFTIQGAVKASNGEEYRFPMTFRML